MVFLVLLAQIHAAAASSWGATSGALTATGFVQSGRAGLGGRAPMRACTATALMARRNVDAHACIVRALKDGRDSTWQLLRAAWLAFQQDDTTTARTAFLMAMRAAHDPASRADIGWHFERVHDSLGTPPPAPKSWRESQTLAAIHAEKAEWLQLPDSAAIPWLRAQMRLSIGQQTWRSIEAWLGRHFRNLTLDSAGDFKACVVGQDAAPPCPVVAGGATLFSATRWRLWDARTLAPVSVLALRVDRALATPTSLAVTLDQSGDCDRAGDGTQVVVPVHPTDSATVRGSFLVTRPGSCDRWEARVYRAGTTPWVSGASGGALADSAGDPSVSDLVIGSRPVTWSDSTAAAFDVTPQFSRTAPAYIYLQMLATRAETVSVGMTVQATVGDRASVLNIASRSSLPAGLTEYARSIDLSRFPPGVYQLRITLRHPDGAVIAMRESPFDVR